MLVHALPYLYLCTHPNARFLMTLAAIRVRGQRCLISSDCQFRKVMWVGTSNLEVSKPQTRFVLDIVGFIWLLASCGVLSAMARRQGACFKVHDQCS